MNFIAISAWYSVFRTLSYNLSLTPDADGNYRFDSVTFDQIKHAIGLVCNQSWDELNGTDQYRPCKTTIHPFRFPFFFFFSSSMFQFDVSLDIIGTWVFDE